MTVPGAEAFHLPPLILHPFSNTEDTSVLVESSRASLTLQGFLPNEQSSADDLEKKLLRGRHAELRMLYYIGKDLTRWMEQCTETALSSSAWHGQRIQPETFGVFLIEHIPDNVRTKLEGWGVLDYSSLFRRALGLHAVFEELPPAAVFSATFLRHYHSYADLLYDQRLRNIQFDSPQADWFKFDLYASGEYTLLLEQTWNA